MKKKAFLSCLLLSLSFCKLGAMPVLNPAEPELLSQSVFCCNKGLWGIKFGYRGDFTLNSNLKTNVISFDKFSIFANQGVLTLTLWDRLDIYLFGGPAAYDFSENHLGVFLNGNGSSRMLWGSGLKVIVFTHRWVSGNKSYVSFDAQYEGMPSCPLNSVSRNASIIPTNGVGYYFRQAQISLIFGHRIKNIIPYIAAKYTNTRANLNRDVVGALVQTLELYRLKSRSHAGYAIGLTYIDSSKMSITGEARFIDEKAFTIAANIRF
jgi:hypothetical protein